MKHASIGHRDVMSRRLSKGEEEEEEEEGAQRVDRTSKRERQVTVYYPPQRIHKGFDRPLTRKDESSIMLSPSRSRTRCRHSSTSAIDRVVPLCIKRSTTKQFLQRLNILCMEPVLQDGYVPGRESNLPVVVVVI